MESLICKMRSHVLFNMSIWKDEWNILIQKQWKVNSSSDQPQTCSYFYTILIKLQLLMTMWSPYADQVESKP